jgi:hypothetical protein
MREQHAVRGANSGPDVCTIVCAHRTPDVRTFASTFSNANGGANIRAVLRFGSAVLHSLRRGQTDVLFRLHAKQRKMRFVRDRSWLCSSWGISASHALAHEYPDLQRWCAHMCQR